MSIEISSGGLYLVATPIGNLGDISQRALDVLGSVDLIAAEDTRHSHYLLSHYGIQTRLQAYHEHNEETATAGFISRLLAGESIALISDAGTPLVSDPGYRLVEQAHQNMIPVIPIPGACAAIVALAASGMATDRFVFEGFPPAKQGVRLNSLKRLQDEPRTMVFYISCHRLLETIDDMRSSFGDERPATMAREITKTFETIKHSTLTDLYDFIAGDPNQLKGEIVLVVAGQTVQTREDPMTNKILETLLEELPVKQASSLTSRITGANKNDLYKAALKLKENK